MTHSIKHKLRSGFGLIEIAVSLALASGLGFIALQSYSSAKQARDTQEIIKQIGLMQTIVKAHDDMKNDNNSYRISQMKNLIPDSIYKKGINESYDQILLLGRYDLKILLGSDTISGRKRYRINYTINNIPDKMCSKLTSSDYGRELISIAANQFETTIRGREMKRRYTTKEAALYCKNKNNNSISIVMRK